MNVTEVRHRIQHYVRKNNSIGMILLKWIILGVIAIAALNLGEVSSIQQNLSAFPARALLLFVATGILSRVFYTLRWHQINIGVGGQKLPFTYLFRVGLLSEFVSIVLPSYLGGDGVRLIKLHEQKTSNSTAFLSIFIDRVAGVIALALLTAVFVPSVLPLLDLDITISPIVFVVAGILAAIAAGVGVLVMRRWHLVRLPAFLQGLQVMPLEMVISGIYSLLGHLVYVAGYYILFRELVFVDFVPLAAIVLLALLTRTIPLSLFGVDVSDGSIIVLAGLLGIQTDISVAVVAILIISRYAFSLTGLLIELAFDGKRVFLRKPAEPTVEPRLQTGELRRLPQTGELRLPGTGELRRLPQTGELRLLPQTGELRLPQATEPRRQTGELRRLPQTGELRLP